MDHWLLYPSIKPKWVQFCSRFAVCLDPEYENQKCQETVGNGSLNLFVFTYETAVASTHYLITCIIYI